MRSSLFIIVSGLGHVKRPELYAWQWKLESRQLELKPESGRPEWKPESGQPDVKPEYGRPDVKPEYMGNQN